MLGHLAPELSDFGNLNTPGTPDSDGLEVLAAEQGADPASAHLTVGLRADAGEGDPVFAGRSDGEALHAAAHFIFQGTLGFKNARTPQGRRIFE